MAHATDMIRVPKDIADVFASATAYQRRIALRTFRTILKTPEEQLYPTLEDSEKEMDALEKYQKSIGFAGIERLDEKIERIKNDEQKRIGNIGLAAYALELDALAENDPYADAPDV